MGESKNKRCLEPLFKPDHVAIIGASRTPGKHGYRVVENIARHGFKGRLSLVNASGGEADGVRYFKSIEEAPGRVDCAIIVIPAERVVEAVRQCANARARAIVIAAVGFAELGTEVGRKRQQQIIDIVQAHGIALLGPNTNGIFNRSVCLSLGTNTSHGEPIDAGPISIVSHSGALFNHVARRLRQYGAGLSKFVPVGNEADLNMLDILEYLIEDDATSVIGMIIEGLSNGARFRRLAEQAREAGKPIVALKLGRSAVGAESSLAHSSRLAGEARTYDAMFRICDVATVSTVEALAGGCSLLAGRKLGKISDDQRLLCISNSGAGAALLADFAERYGIPLLGDGHGNWEEPIASYLAQIGTRAEIRHPIDTGSLGNVRLLEDVLEAVSRGGATGPTVVFSHTILTPGRAEADAQVVIDRHRQNSSPTMVLTPGGLGEAIETLYVNNGVPVFRDTGTLFDSLRCHYVTLRCGEAASRVDPAEELSAEQKAGINHLLEHAAAAQSRVLTELDSAAVLRSAGIPVVTSTTVDNWADARAYAAGVGYPVVLKALAPNVAHKNKFGFVVTNISDEQALQREYSRLEARVVAQGYSRDGVAFIVQPMLRSNAELIVGVTHEPALGHFLLVGLGGIYTEVLDLSITIPIPFGTLMARAWIEETRLGGLLRTIDPGGGLLTAVIEVLDRLQALMLASGGSIEAIDINPLLVGAWGCMAVDALVILKGEP